MNATKAKTQATPMDPKLRRFQGWYAKQCPHSNKEAHLPLARSHRDACERSFVAGWEAAEAEMARQMAAYRREDMQHDAHLASEDE